MKLLLFFFFCIYLYSLNVPDRLNPKFTLAGQIDGLITAEYHQVGRISASGSIYLIAAHSKNRPEKFVCRPSVVGVLASITRAFSMFC